MIKYQTIYCHDIKQILNVRNNHLKVYKVISKEKDSNNWCIWVYRKSLIHQTKPNVWI